VIQIILLTETAVNDTRFPDSFPRQSIN